MRFTHRALMIFVLRVVTNPRKTLALSAIVLVACIGLAVSRLNISTDTNKLFDPNVPFFRDYLNYIKLFPENEAIYVVIESKDATSPPPIQRWTAIADLMIERLRGLGQHVQSVDGRVPTDKLGPQGLLFDDPTLVQENFDGVKRFIPLVKLWGEKPGLLTQVLGETPIERFITGVRLQKADEETAGFIAEIAQSWNTALAELDQPLKVGSSIPDFEAMGATDPSRLGYYYVKDESDPSRNLMLVRIYHHTTYDSLTAISKTVEAIRGAVDEVARGFPEFLVGVTGRPALEADEMRTSDTDSHRAEAVALIAIFVGLVVMLRSVWLALAGEIALCVGIGWTFGWATISVGELNLLSIVFLLALIGIGMDYLVQILTRYRQEQLRRPEDRRVWIAVFRHVAAPINTACLGAAGAFLVSYFTRFKGAAQLGVIAGGGLLLCLLAGYVVLPALLTLFPPRIRRSADLRDDLGPPARATNWNLITPCIWIALLVIASPFALRTGFNPNLIELQAPDQPSVKLVRKLQTFSATVLTRDLDTLRQVRDAVATSPEVSHTESILQAYDNLAWLRDREHELPEIAWSDPATVDVNDLERLSSKAVALAEHFKQFASAAEQLKAFAGRLKDARPEVAAKVASRLSTWQTAFIAELKEAVAPFHPTDLDIARLPIEMRSHFASDDGTYALYIYPAHDVWDHAALGRFVRDVEARVLKIPGEHTLTGIAVNIFYSSSSIEASFYAATAYALGLIFLLVLIDLRSVKLTLLAISVLALGLPMLVSLTGLIGQKWNFANFFGLPILIGAGHEYGVFMVHRYREAIRAPRRVWRRWDVSDKALLLCAYVTCVSFGFFWLIARHRGLRSLGLVMALGTACIYLATIMVLRPLLIRALARRARKDAKPER